MSEERKVSRRGYVKYAAAGVVVVAGAAAGAYYFTRPPAPPTTTTTATTVPTTAITTPTIPNPNTIIYATDEPMVSLDPAWTVANTDYRETYLMYDRLVTYRGASTTPEPMLAKSYDISEDGLAYTFHLRDGVKFHDGTTLDANAVVSSFLRALKLGEQGGWAGTFIGIVDEEGVKAVDDYTVQFNLRERYAPFVPCLAVQALGIVSPKVMEHETEGDLGKAWLSQNEAGSGSFKLKEYVPNEKIVLSAVKDYWGGVPKIDEMIVQIITEPSTQRLMLETGEIDGAEDIPVIALSELSKNPDIHVVDDPGFFISFMILNTQKKLKDAKVRKAIAHAVDFDGIINDINFGRGTRLRSALPKGFPGADESIPLYDYDLDKTQVLLADAGYDKGLELDMLIAPFEEWIKISTSLQSSLAKVNVKLNIQQFAWPTYIEKLSHGDHDLALMGWTPDYADPNMQVWFYFYSKNAGPGWNFAFYNNPKVDQLIIAGRSETDMSKRLEMYSEIQKITVDEAPYIWLYQGLGYGGLTLRSWVKGYVFNPLNAWFIPADTVYKA